MPVRTAWRDVPRLRARRFAALAMAEVPALAQAILGEIRQEYPGLPLVVDESGEPMALIGIREALEDFVGHLVVEEHRPHGHQLEVFQEFGRGEVLQGRSLDSLQAIYRLGVRLAWRRLAEIGQQVEIPPCGHVRAGGVGLRVSRRARGPVRTRLRGSSGPPGRRTAAAAAAADQPAAQRAPHRSHRRPDRACRAHRLAAARTGRRRSTAAARPGVRRPGRGTGRAAGHGVRAAAHGRPRAARGRAARTPGARDDRLVRRDGAAGSARRGRQVAALGLRRRTPDGARPAPCSARCCSARSTPRRWSCSRRRN